MKHARKTLAILFLFVTPLLLSGIITTVPEGQAMVPLSVNPTKVALPSYDPLSPIVVWNNSMLENYATSLSWDGDGSPSTPFIIEGYNITHDADCISIIDVTLAFEIRDCYLKGVTGGSGNGVYLSNVAQVSIVDTVILDKAVGIVIAETPAPVIDNCTISLGVYGVQAALCSDMNILDSTIHSTLDNAVMFIECNDTVLLENEIYDTITGAGIRMDLSDRVSVMNNHIHDCGFSGVYAVYSDYLTAENNIIHDCLLSFGPFCGVHLEYSDYATIIGNELYDNSHNGIRVTESDWVYIADNEIYGNSDHGIDVHASFNGTVIENNIYENGWWPVVINELCGIYMSMAEDWEIRGNSIWNNTPSGISMNAVINITIVDNNIFLNEENGIYAVSVSEALILENELSENGWGVINAWEGNAIMLQGTDSLVEGNRIFNNTNTGFYGYGSDNVVRGNTVYNHPEWGIGLAMATNYLIHENVAFDNGFGIFLYTGGTNVTDNIVYDNTWGIHLYATSNTRIYGNDIGWNTLNAQQNISQTSNLWYDSATETGNHWHDHVEPGGEAINRYPIYNGTHVVAFDNYAACSLNLTDAPPIDFEILETGNVIVFDAYALNPSHYEVFVDAESVLVEDWNGGPIEFVADGLSHGIHTIGIEVFHFSGHSLENGTTADVEDLTPPEVEGQAHVVIYFGDNVSVQFTGVDPSGIASWAVNDTVNFAISSTGLLTNIADLPVGDYVVVITATDSHGNAGYADITISVLPATGGGMPTTMLLILGGGAAALVVVLIIVMVKKKGT